MQIFREDEKLLSGGQWLLRRFCDPVFLLLLTLLYCFCILCFIAFIVLLEATLGFAKVKYKYFK